VKTRFGQYEATVTSLRSSRGNLWIFRVNKQVVVAQYFNSNIVDISVDPQGTQARFPVKDKQEAKAKITTYILSILGSR